MTNQNNAAQPTDVLVDYEVYQEDELVASSNSLAHAEQYAEQYGQDGPVELRTSISIPGFHAVESALLSKLRAPVAGELAVDLFRSALAWGYVYGPKLNKDQWERMRDETAQQFSQRLAALACPPVDDGELRTAFNEWIDKTDFIQQRIASGELPVKYLGWHRADVMRDLIDAAARNPVLPSGCIVVQEADTIPHTHPEYGPGIFFTEDARIEFDAAPQASAVAGEAQPSDYVQTVPEHCDRILWRGQYYALPLYAAPQASEAVLDEDVATLLNFIFERFSAPCKAGDLPGYVVPAIRRLERAALSAQPELSSGAPNGRKRTAAERRAPMVERVYGTGVTAQPAQKEGGSDA